MAFSLNRAQIIGNLTRDPEVKVTTGNQKVATFSVATNFSWTDSTGTRKEKVEYHNIVVWRKLAEIVEQYVKKGQKVYVEGRMQTRDWEGEDGVKRYKTEIVAENLIMLGGKRMGEPAGDGEENGLESMPSETPINFQSGKGSLKKSAPAAAKAAEPEEVTLDDLPF